MRSSQRCEDYICNRIGLRAKQYDRPPGRIARACLREPPRAKAKGEETAIDEVSMTKTKTEKGQLPNAKNTAKKKENAANEVPALSSFIRGKKADAPARALFFPVEWVHFVNPCTTVRSRPRKASLTRIPCNKDPVFPN